MARIVIPHANTAQETGYWCGPASAQNILSGLGINVSERELAGHMFTTQNGTDTIDLVRNALNRYVPGGWYTRYINRPPTADVIAQLWADLVTSVDAGKGVECNIVAVASNRPPGYPASDIYHYVSAMGYETTARGAVDPGENLAVISDPARFGGLTGYDLTIRKLATLIDPKGYAAGFGTTDPVWSQVMAELVG